MEVVQSFRLIGKTDIEDIPCDQIDGQNIVYWEDIEQVFPGIQHIKNGTSVVKLLRDSNQNRIIPHRIKHYPGVILDVILSTTAGLSADIRTGNPTSAQSEDIVTENLRATVQSTDTPISGNNVETLSGTSTLSTRLYFDGEDSRTTHSPNQVMKVNQANESEIEQQPFSSLSPNVHEEGPDSSSARSLIARAMKDGRLDPLNQHLVELLMELKGDIARNNEMATLLIRLQEVLNMNQQEMKQLQIQALNRLTLLQNRIQALLTQSFELHEYPIPRLFVVLPQDSSSWNPLDLFSNKFRLYFLCECGEHTKSTNSKIPHHIHLAKHEGYDIARPTEFFQQYGSYILTILRMIKFGISMAGIAVPTVSSHLVREDAIDEATASLKMLVNHIHSGMEQAIGYIEKVTGDKDDMADGSSGQIGHNEALEGADLRRLETFLKKKDENRVLGNLYRTVTTEGHVKWVCIDHYRENYHARAVEAFRDAMKSLDGWFQENTGLVHVKLRSRVQAEQFYLALERAKSVYELEVEFFWDATQSDFKQLRDTLAKTNVGVLELDLCHRDGPTSDILNRNHRYDPVLDIMRHPSIQSVTISGAKDFFKRSSLLSRGDDFPNLRHLSISLYGLKNYVPGLKSLVAKTPKLSKLTLDSAGHQLLHIYNAIAEHQTYPIIIKDDSLLASISRELTIPLPTRGPDQSMAAYQYMEHLLRHHNETIELPLKDNELEEATLDAIAKATAHGSELKRLVLTSTGRLGDTFIKNVVSIVAHPGLRKLKIYMSEDVGRVRILESIQWEHLRELEITMKPGSLWKNVMKALVNGKDKRSGGINLEAFTLSSDSRDPLLMAEDELLTAFFISISLKKIALDVLMTLEQILALLKWIDFSRLSGLLLSARGFNSTSVEAILNGLWQATALDALYLWSATITDEQIEQMATKGVTLKNRFGR